MNTLSSRRLSFIAVPVQVVILSGWVLASFSLGQGNPFAPVLPGSDSPTSAIATPSQSPSPADPVSNPFANPPSGSPAPTPPSPFQSAPQSNADDRQVSGNPAGSDGVDVSMGDADDADRSTATTTDGGLDSSATIDAAAIQDGPIADQTGGSDAKSRDADDADSESVPSDGTNGNSEPDSPTGSSNESSFSFSDLDLISYWPYLAGLGALVLLSILMKVVGGKKGDRNRESDPEVSRVIDPSKAKFKKSKRFADASFGDLGDEESKKVNLENGDSNDANPFDIPNFSDDQNDDRVSDVVSDVMSEADERVSGLRLNESDVLDESLNEGDQSDLNFGDFDAELIQSELANTDSELDDDDFAAMMLEDDDEEKIIVQTDGDEFDESQSGDRDELSLPRVTADSEPDSDGDLSEEGFGFAQGPEFDADEKPDSEEFSFDLDDEEDLELKPEFSLDTALAEFNASAASENETDESEASENEVSENETDENETDENEADENEADQKEALSGEVGLVKNSGRAGDDDSGSVAVNTGDTDENDLDAGDLDADASQGDDEDLSDLDLDELDDLGLDDLEPDDLKIDAESDLSDLDLEPEEGLPTEESISSQSVAQAMGETISESISEMADEGDQNAAQQPDPSQIDDDRDRRKMATGIGVGAAAAGVAALGAAFSGGAGNRETESLQALVNDLESKLVDQEAEHQLAIDRLQGQLESAKSTADELASAAEKLKELELQKSQALSDFNLVQQEVETLKVQLHEANAAALDVSQLEEAEKEITDLKSELSKTSDAASESQSEIAELKSEIQRLGEEAARQAETAQKTEDTQNELAQAKQEMEKLETELKEAAMVKDETLTEVEELRASLAKLKSENEELAQSLQRTEEELAETQDLQDQRRNELNQPSLVAGQGSDAAAELGVAVEDDAASDSEISKQLQEELQQERELRLSAEEMLVEAEDQRTVVAQELRKVRKELKQLTEHQQQSQVSAGDTLDSDAVDSAQRMNAPQTDENADDDSDQVGLLKQQLTDAESKIADLSAESDEWAKKLSDLETEVGSKKKE